MAIIRLLQQQPGCCGRAKFVPAIMAIAPTKGDAVRSKIAVHMQIIPIQMLPCIVGIFICAKRCGCEACNPGGFDDGRRYLTIPAGTGNCKLATRVSFKIAPGATVMIVKCCQRGVFERSTVGERILALTPAPFASAGPIQPFQPFQPFQPSMLAVEPVMAAVNNIWYH